MNKRAISEIQENAANPAQRAAASKLAISLVGLTAMMLLAVLVITSITLAQSSTVTVAAGETLEAICEGRGFQLERASRTHVILACVASNRAGEVTGQSSGVTVAAGETLEAICEGRGFQLERASRTHVILACVAGSGAGEPTPLPPQPTDTPAAPPPAEPTSTPVPPEPTNTPSAPPPVGPVEPYPGAPACAEIGLLHDPRAWHGIWDYEHGCHWDHEHKANPHDMDDIFGMEVYQWAGGELSYPWQTFHGAGANFEEHHPGTCTENECKHVGYSWLYIRGRACEQSPGADNCITDARVQYHQIGGQVGALTRFHSVWLEARACRDYVASAENCGVYRGGGWLDLGKLNLGRGHYVPLPGDPPIFAELVPEVAPYRIHNYPGQPSLDSWQSEGNEFNYLPSDPNGDFRLRVGYGVHFNDSPGGADPANFDDSKANQHFWCLDEATQVFTCDKNSSEAALFRVWVIIPRALDGSRYDEDGQVNGFFTFHGYTNRYGDIVEGCSAPALDCVPAEAENVPVNRSRYRGTLEADNVEFDLSPYWSDNPRDGRDWWIKYPN